MPRTKHPTSTTDEHHVERGEGTTRRDIGASAGKRMALERLRREGLLKSTVDFSASASRRQQDSTSDDEGDEVDEGDEGDEGDESDKGDEGDEGDEGDRGDEGDEGDEGDRGDEGDEGDRGDEGDDDRGKGKKKMGRKRLDDRPVLSHDCAPRNRSLLYLFDDHCCRLVWNNIERPTLRCYNHLTSINKWIMPAKKHKVFWDLLEKSGLLGLRTIMHKNLDAPFISALVERWYPETNSFHLPFGEMTIILDDVHAILGLGVNGHAVDQAQMSQETGGPFANILEEGRGQLTVQSIEMASQLGEKYLGIPHKEIADEVKKNRKFELRLGWLRKKAPKLEDNHEYDEAYQANVVRCYLLHLLGCTIFSDKTGDKVSIKFIFPLSNVDKICDYSWASATLAHTYRQLGLASRTTTTTMSGCLTLIQAWGYEYFVKFRKGMNQNYDVSMPRAQRWKPSRQSKDDEHAKMHIREELDGLHGFEVDWLPYKKWREVPNTPAFQPNSLYRGFIKVFNIVEPYLPDRVLRQFGHAQTRPMELPKPVHVLKIKDSVEHFQAHRKFEWDNDKWINIEQNRLTKKRLGKRASVLDESTRDYKEWYQQRTHTKLINPEYHTITLHPDTIRLAQIREIVDNIFDMGIDMEEPVQEALVTVSHITHEGEYNASTQERGTRRNPTRNVSKITRVQGGEGASGSRPPTKSPKRRRN